MANPSVNNGHIDIANELAEKFATLRIPGEEWSILWVVLRQTWGWKKEDRKKDLDWISLTQFEQRTGMKRANVARSLRVLVAKRLLLKTEKGYGINQNHDEWVVVKRLPQVANRLLPSSQTATSSSSQLTPKSSSQLTTHNRKKDIIKDTYTKDSVLRTPDVLDDMENEYRKFLPVVSKILQHEKTFTREGLKKWKTRRLKYSALELGQAFVNLQYEQDQWKISNNGFRPMTWWLRSDAYIVELQNCHLKKSSNQGVIIS